MMESEGERLSFVMRASARLCSQRTRTSKRTAGERVPDPARAEDRHDHYDPTGWNENFSPSSDALYIKPPL